MDSFIDRATDCMHYIADMCDKIPGTDYEDDRDSLTIHFTNGYTYLFNIHKGLQQLWVASPFSGGRHFVWCQSLHAKACPHPWVDTRNQEYLLHVLDKEWSFIGSATMSQ